jgi:hypothetical protein
MPIVLAVILVWALAVASIDDAQAVGAMLAFCDGFERVSQPLLGSIPFPLFSNALRLG